MDEIEIGKVLTDPKWVVAAIITVLVIGAGFYWVAIRPNMTRKSCNHKALISYADYYLELGYYSDSQIKSMIRSGNYENDTTYLDTYNACLANAGLSNN